MAVDPRIPAEPAPVDPASTAPGEPTVAAPPDPPLPPLLAGLSLILFAALAVLCAVIEVTLVPLRLGTTVVPLSVLLAVVSNVAVPTLSRRAVPVTAAALLPALAWAATVIVLSSARPEGDVLLVGTAPLVYVTYALLGAGIVSAMVTVVRGQARAGAVRTGSSVNPAPARSTRR